MVNCRKFRRRNPTGLGPYKRYGPLEVGRAVDAKNALAVFDVRTVPKRRGARRRRGNEAPFCEPGTQMGRRINAQGTQQALWLQIQRFLQNFGVIQVLFKGFLAKILELFYILLSQFINDLFALCFQIIRLII